MTPNTPRFGYLDALRALAVGAILLYEIVEHAPGLLFPHPIAHRLAFAGVHGFEVFLVISGFVLAYPALAALHHEGSASLDVRQYALDRIARVLPAYYAVLAATIFFPYVAARYGLTAFGHVATLPPLRSIVMQALFAQQHFGNDAFWALAVQMRVFLLFPILFALYVRKPVVFYTLAIAAAPLDLFTPAHRFDLGALPAFMLGIVAADWRARQPVIARFALPIAIAASVGAFFADPAISSLPGPRLTNGIENWNPLWSLAAFALVAACGSLRWTQRALSFPGLPQLGRCAFAMVLVAEPVAVYLMRKATPTLGLPVAAANAFLVAMLAGIVLWLAIDRRFGSVDLWRSAISQSVAFFARVRSGMRAGPMTFESAVPALRGGESHDISELPLLPPSEVSMLINRSGSADDLASELRAAASRFSERGSFDPSYFDPRRPFRDEIFEESDVRIAAAVESGPRAEAPRSPIHYHLGPMTHDARYE